MFYRTSFKIVLAIFLISLLKSIFFSFFGLSLVDDGESLHNGTRVLKGGQLYEDIMTFFPPLDDYFPAFALKISNNSLHGLQFAESIVFSIFVSLLALLLLKIVKRPYLIVLLWLMLLFSDLNVHLLHYQLYLMGAIILLFLYSRLKNKVLLVFSGISLGVGSLFRHDAGSIVFLVIGFSLYLQSFFEHGRHLLGKYLAKLGFILAGLFVIWLPVILLLLLESTFDNFIYLLFIKAPTISGQLRDGLDLISIFSSPITLAKLYRVFGLFYYLVFFAVYAIAAIHLYKKIIVNRKVNSETILIVALTVYGVLSIPYALSIIEIGHLVKAAIPGFVLWTILTDKGLNIVRLRYLAKFSLVCQILFLVGGVVMSVWWIGYNDTLTTFKQGSVYLPSKYISGSTHVTSDTMVRTLDFIEANTQPGDYIFAGSYHAMIYFLSERESPSWYDNYLAGFIPPDEEKLIIESMERVGVNVVVYDPSKGPHSKKVPDYNPQIHAYLMSNFTIVEQTPEGWLLMRRKEF